MIFSANQKTGLAGEVYAARQLVKRGYSVRVPPDFNQPAVDLKINDVLPVEVKLSNRRTRRKGEKVYPKWQWKTGSIDTADRVLILIADDGEEKHLFILPGALMAHRSSFEINSHPDVYRGMLAAFRDNWDVVDFLLEQRYRDNGQLSLMGGG